MIIILDVIRKLRIFLISSGVNLVLVFIEDERLLPKNICAALAPIDWTYCKPAKTEGVILALQPIIRRELE